MNRRELLVMLSGGALATPLGALAQQPGKIWRVGYLGSANRPDSITTEYFGAFVQGLRELGYVEGRNLSMEWRFAEGNLDRLPALAAELVQLKVDAILAGNVAATAAAKKATTTLPIVMGSVSDPVGFGLISSLARPGGNVTGPSSFSGELGAKRLELLLEMAPRVSRLAVLMNPANPAQAKVVEILEAAAQQRRLSIVRTPARTPQEIESAFATMAKEKVGALIIPLDPFFNQQRKQITTLSEKLRLPTMTPDPIYVEAGCLMSYGTSLARDLRRAAVYVDKIFKGAKPADLPVEEPTRMELVINRKTAKALGLTIPQSLLISVDRVIE